MKQLIRLALCVLPISAIAQKDSSYSIEIGAPATILKSIPKTTIENTIGIRGLKKDSTSPSYVVSFNTQDLVINEYSVKEYVQVQPDNSKKTSYYVEALYTLRCEGKCYDSQKKLLYSGTWGTGKSKYMSSYMDTREAADQYWKANKDDLQNNFIASILNPAMVAMGNKLSASYGPAAHQ